MKGFKNVVFWAHLVCAIPAAVFILIMSVTGVLLTYEAQMVESATHKNNLSAVPNTTAMSLDALLGQANIKPTGNATLVVNSDPTVPVTISMGREGSVLLNPYTGARIEDQAQGTRSFLGLMERWHRNLNSPGDTMGAWLIKASNLIFLFLVLSGIYIWLPPVYRWVQFRGRMFFNAKNVNSKARDFNWHHVFSFWALIPLFVIVLSGVVMSYQWANKALFAVYGEEAPQRGGPGGPGGPPGGPAGPQGAGMQGDAMAAGPQASLDALFATASTQVDNWQTISLPLRRRGDTVTVTVELPSIGEQRPPRQQLRLSNVDGAFVRLEPVMPAGPPGGQQSAAQRARGWMRFAHTGEEYGVIGQTIAGIASLAACFLAYTGLALAYRRLIVPLYRRT